MSLLYAVAQSAKYEQSNPGKHATWCTVIQNMASGAVDVGSRAPIAATPVWVTPKVVSGGFATGELCAGGDLTAYERDVAGDAQAFGFAVDHADGDSGDRSTRTLRASANRFLVEHERGFARLREMLRSHKYRVSVPEEGCLLVFAWLCEHNHALEAQELLTTVMPLFDQLRFHSEPRDEPEDTSLVPTRSPTAIHTKLSETLRNLKRTDLDSLASHALEPRLESWFELREEVVKLWLQTLDEPASPPNGTWTSENDDRSSKPLFEYTPGCGWPCQTYPMDWNVQAARVIALFETVFHDVRAKRRNKYARMVASARKVLAVGPHALTGSDVAWIRFGIASMNAKRGLPESEAYRKWLGRLVEQRARWFQAAKRDHELCAFAVERLASIAKTASNRDDELKPYLTESEARSLSDELITTFSGHRGTKTIVSLLDKTVGMSLEQVFTSGRFKSLEMVAQILPAFTGAIRTRAIADPDLRYLYQQILVAFAARRSLLLLNFASQVRVTELPWIRIVDAVMAASATGDESERVRAATTDFCRNITVKALRYFGEAPLCNPFIRELKPLVERTQLKACYLVEEIAADIFMGSFVPKFVRTYEVAQAFLQGTKYQAYYRIREPEATPLDTNGFAALCRVRTGDGAATSGWSITENAKLIEQSQILTTHNLASLFVSLELHACLDDLDVPGILERCWKEIMRLATLISSDGLSQGDWRIQGQFRRYIGYSWRQMLFFFAVLEKFAPESYASAIEAMKAGTAQLGDDEYRAHFEALANVLTGEDVRVPMENRTGSYVVAWGRVL